MILTARVDQRKGHSLQWKVVAALPRQARHCYYVEDLAAWLRFDFLPGN